MPQELYEFLSYLICLKLVFCIAPEIYYALFAAVVIYIWKVL